MNGDLMKRCATILFLGFTLAGCDKLFSESEAWRKQVDKEVQDLRKTATELKDAIPGERFIDRLMKAKTGTPEEQAKAKAEIAALYGIDPTVTYQASVWVEGLGSEEKIDIAATFVPVAASKVLHDVITQRRENLIPLSSIGTAAVTPETIRTEITNKALAAIEALGGTISAPAVGPAGFLEYTVSASAWFPEMTFLQGGQGVIPAGGVAPRTGNMIFAGPTVQQASSKASMDKVRKAAAEKWMEAIAPQATVRLVATSSFPVKWSPSLTDALIVWMRDEDWKKYRTRMLKPEGDKEAIRIRALLHKVGDQNTTYQLQPRRWFENRDFDLDTHKVVDETVKEQDVYRWAAMDIAGNAPIAAERLRQMNAYVAAYEKLGQSIDDIRDGRAPAERSWWQFWKDPLLLSAAGIVVAVLVVAWTVRWKRRQRWLEATGQANVTPSEPR